MLHDIIDILRNTLLITGLVIVMMLMIEYVNVVSQGRQLQKLRNSRFKQVVVAALFGIVPGCVGGFAVVSLYTHGVVNFGALTAAMISSSGDEAFVMLATIPKTAIIIIPILFAIAVAAGLIINTFVKKSPSPTFENHLEIHNHEIENVHGNIVQNLKNITFQRATLMAGILIFIFGIVSGLLDHEHEHEIEQGVEHIHEHSQNLGFIFNERWVNLLFAAVSLVSLYIIARVSNHFLQEHLWGHIIKKHFAKIFLWTFGALLVIYLLLEFVDISAWISDNRLSILMIALLVGIIPESGPHILFIMLFMQGHIPLSILLANSIVQDGHSTLPLLAESKRSFAYVKIANLIVGAIVGLAGYFFAF